jgi:hypothetical protein
MSDAPYTAAQLAFLRAHRQAVLATGRSDGSPQVSTFLIELDRPATLPPTPTNGVGAAAGNISPR